MEIDYKNPVLFVKLYGRKMSDQMWTYEGLKGIIALRPLKCVPFLDFDQISADFEIEHFSKVSPYA